MTTPDNEYFNLCKHILDNGCIREDRTNVGTKSVFGYQMRFNLQKGFPLLTTKKVYWNGIIDELFWFLSGSTNINDLPERSQQIWSPWSNNNGELGPIYGSQWRDWGSQQIDQIQNVIDSIKKDPNSRRHIVSTWNVSDLDKMALQPCHTLFQFYVNHGKLDCHLYQRSGDVFIGIPFNIASYSLLTHLIAHCTNLEPGEFIHTIGDAHIYLNHLDQVNEQLTRTPFQSPTLKLKDTTKKDIDLIEKSDILLLDYKCHPAIKATIAV